MKKWILLLVFPLLGMPAFAQQKKKSASPKKQHTATTAKKKKAITKPLREPLTSGEPYSENAIDPGISSYGGEAPVPDDTGKVFTSVEEMAEFPGGMSALMHYLGDHIQYPAEAREDNVQGRVVVRFVIDKSGEVRNAVVMRDIGAGCGNEALRVVNSMPKWKPGKMHGQPVHVYFVLPVQFKLQDPDPVPADTTKE